MNFPMTLGFQPTISSDAVDLLREVSPLAMMAREAFGVDFAIWNSETGELIYRSNEPVGANDSTIGTLTRALKKTEPQFLVDEDPVVVVAIPFRVTNNFQAVAVAAFVTRDLQDREPLLAASQALGLNPAETRNWCSQQPVWSCNMLLRMATALQRQYHAEKKVSHLQMEVEKLSDNLASTYEEISLLHGLTQNLRISSDDENLCEIVVNWLSDCVPADGILIQLSPVAEKGHVTYRARTSPVLLAAGNCHVGNERLSEIIASLQLDGSCGPLVINSQITGKPDWGFPEVRQLIIVPMVEGGKVFGWIAAVNHKEDHEFGTVEASLLNSIGALVGIHAGNRDLYRQQSELLASVVKAMSSAIDAKDPYTCGHSDRVARVAVRIAKELGCNSSTLHTVYMAGLLHDVGKIGISDEVLRKPGALTKEEYEHIKQHPELGYRILADLKQLSSILPAVLHHHEQWDGRGYPCSLAGEDIPEIARIMAVADAFDAMTSDRPYRPGMADDKVNQILKDGSGKQWDPHVVEAFFNAREDITAISKNVRANLTLDVQQWL